MNEDLVIVIPSKNMNTDCSIKNEDSKLEPYPFRSEIPSYSFSNINKSTSMVNTSHSKKKLLHRLIHYRRPKRLRSPANPTQTVNTINRSKSAPNFLFSLASTQATSIATTDITITNNRYQSLKTFRRWLNSSSVGQFIQSFIKNSSGNTNISIKKHHKQKTCLKSTLSKKYSDVIY